MSSKRLLLFDFGTEEDATAWDEHQRGDVWRALDIEDLAHGDQYAVAKCATCRHFDQTRPTQWTDRPEGFGECMAFPGPCIDAGDNFAGALAATYDGEGYMSGLYVRPEFGCVAWEVRE